VVVRPVAKHLLRWVGKVDVRCARAVLASVALLVLASGLPAQAHEELSLHAMTVLQEVAPDVPGLEVRIVHMGAPALAVRNVTGKTLTVFDERDRPFLRIGSPGVFANAESPLSYRSVDPAADGVPPGLNGAPRWVRIGSDLGWSWFDPRLTYDRDAPEWRIEMRLGRTPVVALGAFEPLDAHGHFKTQIDTPTVDGLEIRTAEGPVPGLFVRNETDDVLHVEGVSGEPFLRIGPSGVYANVRSPSYFTSALQRIETVPSNVDAGASPRWRRVSELPIWGWLERRAAVPSSLQERSLLGSERRPVLEWTTDMKLGERSLPLDGRVLWVPPHSDQLLTGEGNGEQTYWAFVAVALAAMLWLALRGRRVKLA
jgi:hypothetical protein